MRRGRSAAEVACGTVEMFQAFGGAVRLPNKRMQLTKLRAAPIRQAEVPPCAPVGMTDGGTASQLIRSVRRLVRGRKEA